MIQFMLPSNVERLMRNPDIEKTGPGPVHFRPNIGGASIRNLAAHGGRRRDGSRETATRP
jgi:hypothetical protein